MTKIKIVRKNLRLGITKINVAKRKSFKINLKLPKKSSFLGQIFEKVNISMTKIKVAKKNFLN